MDVVALVVAGLALLLAWRSLAVAKARSAGIDDAQQEARRRAQGVRDEVGAEVAVLRRFVARLASGDRLDPQAVLDGQLWSEVDGRAGQEMLRSEPGLVLVDVRTPQETAAGILPGARLIPLDQLPERVRELGKRDPILLYCAGGARSAAACELLSGQGFERVYNLGGGFSAWTGPRALPGA